MRKDVGVCSIGGDALLFTANRKSRCCVCVRGTCLNTKLDFYRKTFKYSGKYFTVLLKVKCYIPTKCRPDDD